MSIEDSIQVKDSILDILKELKYDSPPKPRVRRNTINVEPGKNVGINITSESDDNDENNIDEPEEIVGKCWNYNSNDVEIENDIERTEDQTSNYSN